MTYARWALVIVAAGLGIGSGGIVEAQATTTTTTTTATVDAAAALDSGDPGTGTGTGTTASAAAAAAPVDDDEHCEQPPAFDPGSPRLDLSFGGGYAAYFVTWRQVSDSFMSPGVHLDGGYFGPLMRGEIELGLGSFSLSVNYTHIFSSHDGGTVAQNVDWALISGEIGLQCACSGATYVWGFGLEVGGDLNSNTIFAGIEHRSQWFVWEGLFLGFDFDLAVLVGLTSHGASGGGFEGSVFLGYSIG